MLRIAQVSGSQSVPRRDQFPAEPWMHFCIAALKFMYFYI
jgi:hypothetical protein